MKINYKNILTSVLLVTGIAISGAAKADLINSDFSSGTNGLDHWNGLYHIYDSSEDSEYEYEVVDSFANFTDNYLAQNNAVTLKTSYLGDDEIFGVFLDQTFTASNTTLSLDYEFLNIDDAINNVWVTLVDENWDVIHDFKNQGNSVDLSLWSGSLVTLDLGILDDNFTLDESLTVSNITFSQQSVPVPEPSSLAMFALAVLMLRKRILSRASILS